MPWSVFDGTPSDSHEDLFRFARLQAPSGKAVLAGLEWADDSGWYIAHALENGFRPSADDVIEILEGWGYSDQEGLLYKCLGPFTQAQVISIAGLVDEGLVAGLVTKSRSFGAEFDDAGIAELGQMTGDAALVDSLVSARIVEKDPYKSWELNTPIGTPSPVEFCSHSMFEGVVAGMEGRFTYDEATDLVSYHICEDYTDDTLEAILSVTDCTAEEADMLLFGNGYSRRPDPLLDPVQPTRPAQGRSVRGHRRGPDRQGGLGRLQRGLGCSRWRRTRVPGLQQRLGLEQRPQLGGRWRHALGRLRRPVIVAVGIRGGCERVPASRVWRPRALRLCRATGCPPLPHPHADSPDNVAAHAPPPAG